jgi:phosphatidylserine/phosphatidylglycerophosphate/cardiolipin synthase-like enzyme
MHLKADSIDGEVLRTGSANFSTSGERAQDNDLIVIRNTGAAVKLRAFRGGGEDRRAINTLVIRLPSAALKRAW